MSHRKVSGLSEIYRINLVRLRRKAKLSVREAAERYGCEPNFISQIEGGHIKAGAKVIEKFSRVYGFPIEEVLRVPPDIGNEELNEWWMRFYNLPDHHLPLVGNVINLIVKHESGELDENLLTHLDNQIKLLLKLSQ